MIPVPPDAAAAALEEQQRQEARRQAEGQSGTAMGDGLTPLVDLSSSGALDAAGQVAGAVIDVAGAALDATAAVAKASFEVVGGILSGLDGL